VAVILVVVVVVVTSPEVDDVVVLTGPLSVVTGGTGGNVINVPGAPSCVTTEVGPVVTGASVVVVDVVVGFLAFVATVTVWAPETTVVVVTVVDPDPFALVV
jgi:hypothetical protein